MIVNSLLIIAILFFAVRIVSKRGGCLGLVLPSTIVIASSMQLLTLEPWNAIFGIAIVILALAVRAVCYRDIKQEMYNSHNDNHMEIIDVEIIGGLK